MCKPNLRRKILTERTFTADEVDAMIARAVAAARPPNTLHFAQWTNGEKDLSNYILVGSLALAGIEDGEYGQSEIDPLDNTIDALQERLVTGSEHKRVPLLAYIGALTTTPPAQPAETSAERTLRTLGYTNNGGEYWKPPLGAIPPKHTEQDPVSEHLDDWAIDRFAATMKAKMAKQREKGYSGWDDQEQCPTGRLQTMLSEHVAKGDPVDVGNFAMMLWNRGEATTSPEQPAQRTEQGDKHD
jgi:hypothetical protein